MNNMKATLAAPFSAPFRMSKLPNVLYMDWRNSHAFSRIDPRCCFYFFHIGAYSSICFDTVTGHCLVHNTTVISNKCRLKLTNGSLSQKGLGCLLPSCTSVFSIYLELHVWYVFNAFAVVKKKYIYKHFCILFTSRQCILSRHY